MKTIYLKFTDEAQFSAALPSDENYPFSIDVIGSICNKDGEYVVGEDGEITTTKEPTKQDGWFVNIYYQGEKPTGYENYEISVATPNRKVF